MEGQEGLAYCVYQSYNVLSHHQCLFVCVFYSYYINSVWCIIKDNINKNCQLLIFEFIIIKLSFNQILSYYYLVWYYHTRVEHAKLFILEIHSGYDINHLNFARNLFQFSIYWEMDGSLPIKYYQSCVRNY